MKRETRDYNMTVKLNQTERTALDKLCTTEALPVTQTVRRLILRAAVGVQKEMS